MRLFATCALVLLAISAPALAQRTGSISTDKTVYAYGEPIVITYAFVNDSDSAYTIFTSSSCQAEFYFDGDSLPEVCTADASPQTIPPRGQRTWRWHLDPTRLGIPSTDGLHTLMAHFGVAYADTVTIEAPAYLGGTIDVHFRSSAPPDSISAMAEVLQAEILESLETPDRLLYEVWRIAGMRIEEALDRFSTASYVVRMDRSYFDTGGQVIVTSREEASMPVRAEIDVPHPNPFTDRTAFSLQLAAAGPVRAVLYDLLGRERGVLFDGYLPAAAAQEVAIEAGDLPAGVYVYRVEAGGGVVTGKVVLRR